MCFFNRQVVRNEVQIRLMEKLKLMRGNLSKIELQNEYKSKMRSQENEEVEHYDQEYRIHFENPKQLIEAIDKIEEDNLQVIQLIQENEQVLIELQQKLNEFDSEKNSKISTLTQSRDELKHRIHSSEEEIRLTQKRSDNFEKEEFSQNMEKIKVLLYQIFQQFKGEFDKHPTMESFKDFDEKQSLMSVLSQIENLIYKFSLSLKKENPNSIFKQVILSEGVFGQSKKKESAGQIRKGKTGKAKNVSEEQNN